MNCGSLSLADQSGISDRLARPQKSKLIIFFITKTPVAIHMPETTSAILPVCVVHRSSM